MNEIVKITLSSINSQIRIPLEEKSYTKEEVKELIQNVVIAIDHSIYKCFENERSKA